MVYLAGIQQRRLVPLTDVTPPLPVDDSLAGWTYRTQSLRVEEWEPGGIRHGSRWWTAPSGSVCWPSSPLR